MQFHIENMTCQHCARAVTHAIQSVAADAEFEIDIGQKTVNVRHAPSEEQIQRALTDAGYPAQLSDAASGVQTADASRATPSTSIATALVAGVVAVFAAPISQAVGALSDVWWSTESPGWALTIEQHAD
jgi:copper chaperone